MRSASFDGFSVSVPDEWVDASTIVLVEPSGEGFSRNLTVTRDYLSSPMWIQAFADQQRSALEESLGAQGFRVLEEVLTSIGGVQVVRRVHCFRVEPHGPEITQIQVHYPLGRSVLTFTLSDLSESFDANVALFESIIESIKGGPHGPNGRP